MTNHEWVKSMSKEELAKFLHKLPNACVFCDYLDECDEDWNNDCVAGWEKWLSAEKEEKE